MPQTKKKRFDVNAFMKAQKEARDRAVQECRSLQGQINRNTSKMNRLRSKVCAMSEVTFFYIVALQITFFIFKLLCKHAIKYAVNIHVINDKYF